MKDPDYYEEIAASLITHRNRLVRKGKEPNAVIVNFYEDASAQYLSEAKKERAWKADS